MEEGFLDRDILPGHYGQFCIGSEKMAGWDFWWGFSIGSLEFQRLAGEVDKVQELKKSISMTRKHKRLIILSFSSDQKAAHFYLFTIFYVHICFLVISHQQPMQREIETIKVEAKAKASKYWDWKGATLGIIHKGKSSLIFEKVLNFLGEFVMILQISVTESCKDKKYQFTVITDFLSFGIMNTQDTSCLLKCLVDMFW